MDEFRFFYKSQHQNKLISGGLMNHILTNLLCEIKNDIHLKALNVSRLSDVYEDNVLDLKRVSDMGRLILNQNFRLKREFIN